MKDEGERLIKDFQATYDALTRAIGRVIVGHERAVREVLVALLAGGHVLLEGVPGLGKTLLVRTLARALDLVFRRIQFTPDLMPADVIGTARPRGEPRTAGAASASSAGRSSRTWCSPTRSTAPRRRRSRPCSRPCRSARSRSAGETHHAGRAVPRARDAEPDRDGGHLPLPEAQLDRFLLKVCLSIEGVDQIIGVIDRTTGSVESEVSVVGGAEEVLRLRKTARGVVLADHLKEFVARLIMATHPDSPGAPERVKRFVKWGASPRGAQAVILAAKVLALTRGRPHVAEEDLRDVAFPALRHRLILSFEGEAEGVTGDDVLEQVLERA